jgi:hypothetical protein
LHPLEGIRDSSILCARLIETHRHEEGTAAGDHVTSLICQIPFQAEVALVARLGVRRDDGHEERTVLDLALDLPIPFISAAQGVAVEPNLDPGGPESSRNAFGGFRILGGIAQEHRSGRLCHLSQFSCAFWCGSEKDDSASKTPLPRHITASRGRAANAPLLHRPVTAKPKFDGVA